MKSDMVRFCLALVCLVLIGMSAVGAHAQNYPVRPIRLVVPSAAGSGADVFVRLISPELTQAFGQQVIVDNRTGAGSNIGADIVAKAPADGYTVLMVLQANAVNVSLYRKLSYDLLRDFEAITQLGYSQGIVVVHPSFPANSISDLVKLAKAKPGAINYGSAGLGSGTFLAAELFKLIAGINMQEVRYKGGGPAMIGVLSGEVSVYFTPLAPALPYIQQGKEARLRPLAVTTAKRLSILPEYPTVAESGYPGYEVGTWYGLMVPAKTPKETIAKIREAAVAALKRPGVIKHIHDLGFTAVGNHPEEFAEYIKSEIERWRKVIRQTGVTAD